MLFCRSSPETGVKVHELESSLAKKWLIHNDDGTLRGPWDASQIRKALRKGLIDPFVTVSEEGSGKKQELIEIDAIFETVEEQDRTVRSNRPEFPSPPGEVTKVVQQVPRHQYEEASYLGLADPSVEIKDNKERRSKVKKFYLIDDKNGKSNMLSAQEITHLYTSKKINNQYRVGKANAKGEISIAKFVKTYKQFSKKSKNDKGYKKKAYKTATVPQKSLSYISGISFGHNQQHMLIIGLCLLLVIAGGTLFFVSRGDFELFKNETTAPIDAIEIKPNRPIKPQANENKPGVNLLDAYNIKKNANKNRIRRQKPAPPPPIRSLPKGVSEGSLIRELSVLANYDNQLVTVGPLSFQPSQLDACKIKCSLIMRDKSKREILVIFFKDAYISELTGKGSEVYVQGTVREQGANLYLSQVF